MAYGNWKVKTQWICGEIAFVNSKDYDLVLFEDDCPQARPNGYVFYHYITSGLESETCYSTFMVPPYNETEN